MHVPEPISTAITQESFAGVSYHVRGELVPGPASFEAEVLDADPRRVKRVKIYRSKDRRPGAGRELPTLVRPPASRPTPRDEPARPNSNTQPSP